MKTNSLLRIILFIIIVGLLSLSCSPTSTSSVTIHINLGLDNKAAFNTPENSIFDRILRFFAKDVKAQTAPLGITSIGLSVTGEGMSTINNSYPADTSTITLDVPAGPARVFQVTAYRPTGDWGGSSAAYDLEAGQSVEIPITMAAQYASVTINPAYPNGIPASSTLTYTVNVTTSGQVVLSSSFTSGTPFQVPAGDSKNFEVLISTPSVTFRGTANLNLAAGSSQTVAIDMTLYETKIVIPDYYSNYRIVQIDDMSGAGWIARTSMPGVTTFRPYDVAFDGQGRIYIANNVGGSGGIANCVIRIDDFNGTTSYLYPNSGSLLYDNGIRAIAVDLNNDYIYYTATNNLLYRASISDYATHTQLSTTDIGLLRGMAVDDQGLLYIVGNNTMGNPAIFIYNPTTQSVVSSVTNATITTLATPWHILIKSPYVYVADSDANYILQLNSSLAYQSELTMSPLSEPFLGPHRFLAILNSRFYTIDEGFDSADSNRIVSFDDISGANWDTYGSTGSGTDQFEFYEMYIC